MRADGYGKCLQIAIIDPIAPTRSRKAKLEVLDGKNHSKRAYLWS
jgi:hypothetical protein